MSKIIFSKDRAIRSTENNEYAEGLRDENLLDENLMIDPDSPVADELDEIADESGQYDPLMYEELGYNESLKNKEELS